MFKILDTLTVFSHVGHQQICNTAKNQLLFFFPLLCYLKGSSLKINFRKCLSKTGYEQ